jgi:hypothetical protein
MSKLISFLKTKGAVTGIALALSFNALMPANAYTYADFHPIADHDYWHTFSVQIDGEPSAGAITGLDGRTAAFLFVKHHLILTLDAEVWNFNPNDQMAVTVTLQGVNFATMAHAVSPSELSIDLDRPEFLKRLVRAKEAVIQVNGERWALNLGGLNDGLTEVRDVMKKIDASF